MKKFFKFFFLITILNINYLFSRSVQIGTSKPFDEIVHKQKQTNTSYTPSSIPKQVPAATITNSYNYDDNFAYFSEFFEKNEDHFLELSFYNALSKIAEENEFNLAVDNKEDKKLIKTAKANLSKYLEEFKNSKNAKYLMKNYKNFVIEMKSLTQSINIKLANEKSKFFSKKTISQKFKDLYLKNKKFIKTILKEKYTDDNDPMQIIINKMRDKHTFLSDETFLNYVISMVSIRDTTPKKEEKEILKMYNKIFSLLNKVYETNVKIEKKKFNVSLLRNAWDKSKKPIFLIAAAGTAYGISALADKYGKGRVKNYGGSLYRKANEIGRKSSEFTKKNLDKGKEKLKSAYNSRKNKVKAEENNNPSIFKRGKNWIGSKFKKRNNKSDIYYGSGDETNKYYNESKRDAEIEKFNYLDEQEQNPYGTPYYVTHKPKKDNNSDKFFGEITEEEYENLFKKN